VKKHKAPAETWFRGKECGRSDTKRTGNAVTVPSPFARDLKILATNIAFGKTSYRENSRESTTSVNSAILLLNLTACHVCAQHSNDISEREKNAKDHMML
jgi:hypothetical protein